MKHIMMVYKERLCSTLWQLDRLFLTAVVVLLASCSPTEDVPQHGGSVGPSNNRVSLAGVVIDGYLEGATVFLDLNGNGTLDKDEPSTITDSTGSYILPVTRSQSAVGASIIVDVPATAIDQDTNLAVASRFVMSAPPEKHGVISPMSTLIKEQMDSDASLSVQNAEDNVKEKIGLSGSSVELLADYVASKNTTDSYAQHYARIHNIARVAASAIKNNFSTITTAASGTDATTEDLMGIIMDNILNELENIALQVDSVPIDNFIPEDALLNTNVNSISTATIIADVANIRTAAQTPVIRLKGSKQVTVVKGTTYVDAGSIAHSNMDGDISKNIVVGGSVNTNILNRYVVTYDVSDAAGNVAAQVTRLVIVVLSSDTTAPVITLNGATNVAWSTGSVYVDAGAVSDDPYATIVVSGHVNAAIAGVYTLTYNAVDGSGNIATPIVRTVTVGDATPPILQLLGKTNIVMTLGSSFNDAGTSAWDATDGVISANIMVTGVVNTNLVGVYTLTYNVSDAVGNAAIAVTRTVHVVDETAPVITLIGVNSVTIAHGSTYVDAGSIVTDNVNFSLIATVGGTVNTSIVGTYTLTYNVSDAASNAATTVIRTVHVTDQTAPQIALIGTNSMTVAHGSIYVDAGSTVTDNVDTNLTVTVTGAVNTAIEGTYTLTYSASDVAGNLAITVTRDVQVILDQTAPVITVSGINPLTVALGSIYVDAGSTVVDNINSGLTAIVTGAVNTTTIGAYILTYNVSDAKGNAAIAVTRTVHVTDQTIPVITIIGANPTTVTQGFIYTDTGSTVTDNVDAGLSATVTGSVDTTTVGTYTLVYNVSDIAGNAAAQVTRIVTVVLAPDTTPPVITLTGTNPFIVSQNSTYIDAGSTVVDNVDINLTATVTGTVDITTIGAYTLTYQVTDAAGNAASVTRTVNVVTGPTPPTAVSLTVSGKALNFSWSAGSSVDHYRISVNPDGISGFTVDPSASNIVNTATTHSIVIPVHKTNWLAAQYIVEACDAAETTCVQSPNQTFALIDSVAATVYVKASNTETFDYFGWSATLSGDGNTMAVGAYFEDSAFNGNQADNTAAGAGAVYVYIRTGTTWVQQAYIKASNIDAGDKFGLAISISNDGNTMAVGAQWEGSAASGIGGNQLDNTALYSGAVYVFSRTGAVWTQQAYVKASNAEANDRFGSSVSLSGDGNTLAVGAFLEGSGATGIGGNQADNSAANSGAVYVFSRIGTVWVQQEYVKSSNTLVSFTFPNGGVSRAAFGSTVSLSSDGNTMAVGAANEASIAVGIDGNQLDNTAVNSGAVYVFSRTGTIWTQQAYVKASNTETGFVFTSGAVAGAGFGSLSLSSDGNTMAVGAYNERSAAIGIGGNQTDITAGGSGAVYVYSRTGAIWTQQAYIKASNAEANDSFGRSVSLSGDGNTMAVGASGEDSTATGISGDQADNTLAGSGAVYVFSRTGVVWTQQAYVKAPNADAGDSFGQHVSLSGDGNTMAVGALGEDSAATGIGGNQADNTAGSSGAVYIY